MQNYRSFGTLQKGDPPGLCTQAWVWVRTAGMAVDVGESRHSRVRVPPPDLGDAIAAERQDAAIASVGMWRRSGKLQ
jgi:hypothetical protein